MNMTTDSYSYSYVDRDENSTTALNEFTQQDWYVAGYYLGLAYPLVVCVIGLPCNIANVAVIWRKWVMSPPTLYIAVLSIVDCIALSHKLLMMHLPTLGVFMSVAGCRYLEYVNQTSSQLSSWTLVLLSAERAMVIKFPFSRRTICSIRRTLVTLVTTTVILALLNCHWLFTVTTFSGRRECTQHQAYRQFITDIWYYVETTLYAFLPFLCLIISNSIIIACLSTRIKREKARCNYSRLNHYRANARGQPLARRTAANVETVSNCNLSRSISNSSGSASQPSPAGVLMSQQYRKITRSTLLASFVFFILTVPYCVTMLSIKHIHITPLSTAHARVVFTTTLVYALRDFSHAVNFFIYALPAFTKFRCRSLLSRVCRSKNNTTPVHTASFKLVSGKESFVMKVSSQSNMSEPSKL